jgi:hypothetical protein
VTINEAVRWVQEQPYLDQFLRQPLYPYLFRVLELSPLVAQAAYDAVALDRACRGQSDSWHLDVDGGRLELRHRAVAVPPRPCYWPYRRERGRIRSARWGIAIPVELELLPHSNYQTEIGLRIRGHLSTGEGRYLDVGHSALDLLATELDAWAFHELYELERALRSA